MLLLGLGLSIAEEFIIQQTSLAPVPWVSAPAYGRAWGVNWIYFLFMLGYESVWVVLVPVQLTELIFPKSRKQPWLKKGGLLYFGPGLFTGVVHRVVFVDADCAAKNISCAEYYPPFIAIFCGALSILMLALLLIAAQRRA